MPTLPLHHGWAAIIHSNVVAVLLLLHAERAVPGAFGLAKAALVRDHIHVAAPDKELDVAGLDVVVEHPRVDRLGRDRRRLAVLAVGRQRQQARNLPGASGRNTSARSVTPSRICSGTSRSMMGYSSKLGLRQVGAPREHGAVESNRVPRTLADADPRREPERAAALPLVAQEQGAGAVAKAAPLRSARCPPTRHRVHGPAVRWPRGHRPAR